MSIEGIKEIMDAFDPASLLPELGTITGKVEFIARVAVMAGPVIVLVLGLLYLFLAPKEANHYFGYRCYFGMGSVEAWRFTQRLAGIVWGALGLLLTIIMFIVISTFRGLEMMDMVWRAACCLFWQVGLIGAACLSINIITAVRFDRKGEYRPKK